MKRALSGIYSDNVVGAYLAGATSFDSVTLEVGCGAAPCREAVNGNYVGIDITKEDYKVGVPRRVDVVADAFFLPFIDETFSVVFYVSVCYHFADIQHAIFEARRVLKPNGYLLVFDYSVKTVKYLGTKENVPVYPRPCELWHKVLTNLGFRASVMFKSLSWRMHVIQFLLPRRLYWKWIDGRKAPILACARKKK